MRFKKILLMLFLSLSICLVACGENSQVTIKLSGESEVAIGESITLSAKASNSSTDFDWDTSDESIATVSEGIVTGIREGTVTITVSLKNNSSVKTTKEITVTNSNEEYNLSVSKKEVSLRVDESVAITAMVTPSTELVWSSSNEKIATVDNGKITGIKSGKAIITVSTIDNKITATINVKVTEENGYTRNDLKRDLNSIKNEYINSSSINLLFETNNESCELIYNKSDGIYKNFKYCVKGNITTTTYVKNGVFYSEIESSKKKSELSNSEELLLVNQYNASIFLKEVTSFYEEEEFYAALNKKQETNEYVEFDLSLNDYYGKSLNVVGVDLVTIKISFVNNSINAVELIFVTKDESSFMKLYYRGTELQNIEYPSDLDSYSE